MGKRKHRGRGPWRRGHPDFWHDWREERSHWEKDDAGPWGHGPPFPPQQVAQEWAEFFKNFMGIRPEKHWAFRGRRFNPWRQGNDSFNPYVASLLSKGGGLLPLYVMQLLSQKPRYGNEIMEIITERTGGQWAANPGAIYPLLTMLEDQGYVEGEWEDPHKRTIRIYRLTINGEKELERLKAVVRPKLVEAIEVLQELAYDLNGDSED